MPPDPLLEVTGLEDDPRLGPYRTLQRQVEHRREGIFVAEGPTVVERLLRSDLPLVSALVTASWLERLGPLLRARAEAFPVFVVADAALLETLTGFEYHQGVLAVARCPAERPLADVLAAAPPGPRLVVALDGVTWPDNLGGILRSAAALGVTAVIAGERSASPWLRRAVRISMGGILFVPVVHTRDLAADLGALARQGFRTVAADAHAGAALPEHAFAADTCIVLGHEFDGVSPAVRAACTDAVTIPMTGAIDSLNVATAAAVLIYEFRRQRPCRPKEASA